MELVKFIMRNNKKEYNKGVKKGDILCIKKIVIVSI